MQWSPQVKIYYKNDDLLLVSAKDWLSLFVAVTIYKQEEELERFVCTGQVVNIQKNGLVQLRLDMDRVSADHIDFVHSAIGDGKLASLIVKPGQRME